jgi:hypothetical protein
MRASARDALREPLAQLTQNASANGPVDESWYWAAPILMDSQYATETTREWWGQRKLAKLWGNEGTEEAGESRWDDHVTSARKILDVGPASLGRPPDDLLDVLAELALGGPAVAAMRALSRVCGGEAALTDVHLRNAAGQIGWAFRSLFNLPEVTALIRGLNPAEPYWRRVIEYATAGCLQSVLDEYVHVLVDSLGLFAAEPNKVTANISQAIIGAVSLRTATPRVDDIRIDDKTGKINLEQQVTRARFAMRFGVEQVEGGYGVQRGDLVRQAFNSPFYPFVLVTTSVGQEGLDFHPYCHAVVHWNLPTNPVDFEQREGRIHRYKGHAVRKNIAARNGHPVAMDEHGDVWQAMFENARRGPDRPSDLELYWVYHGEAKIERHVPTLALSREWDRLPAVRRSLAIYRMVFGQPRQDDLVAYLLERIPRARLDQELHRLRIDLAPGAMSDAG